MAYIVVFAPLLAAAIAGLLQKQIGDRLAQILTTGATIAAALGSVVLFFDVAVGGFGDGLNRLRVEKNLQLARTFKIYQGCKKRRRFDAIILVLFHPR